MAELPGVEIHVLCDNGFHTECPHQSAAGFSFSPKRPPFVFLCQCDCHRGCPVHGRQVPEAVWRRECTCEGSHQLRDAAEQRQPEREANDLRAKEVYRSVTIGRGKSAAEIQHTLLAAFESHGYDPPSDFRWASRLLAAGTAAPGTRTVRIVIELVRQLRDLQTWLRSHPVRLEDPTDAENARELRSMQLSASAFAAIALTFAIAARFLQGVPRIALAIAALVCALLAAWTGLWALAMRALLGLSPDP